MTGYQHPACRCRNAFNDSPPRGCPIHGQKIEVRGRVLSLDASGWGEVGYDLEVLKFHVTQWTVSPGPRVGDEVKILLDHDGRVYVVVRYRPPEPMAIVSKPRCVVTSEDDVARDHLLEGGPF